MKCFHWIVAGVAAISAAASAYAQLPDSKILTYDVAKAIAKETMAECHAHGYHISVLVVDALNEPKVMLRDDEAPGITAEEVKMTATTAMLYDSPSAPGPSPSPDGVSQAFVEGTLKARGAVPIKFGKVTIGAVAVAGAPEREKNVQCATTALAKVADRLK